MLDKAGRSIDALDVDGIAQVIDEGTATAGMVAKLASCRTALLSGVASVRIIDGRLLDGAHGLDQAAGTTLTCQTGSTHVMTTTSTDIKTLEAQHILQNYRRQPVVFERGIRRAPVRRCRPLVS